MDIQMDKLLRILEAEALRHRAQAKVSPDLGAQHLETALALETARALVISTCRFRQLTKEEDNHGNNP